MGESLTLLDPISLDADRVRVCFEHDRLDTVCSEVLLVSDGKKIAVGRPYLEGKTIEGEVLRHGRDKKIIVFKKKRRKKYRLTRGHRQQFTEILVRALPK